MLDSRRSDDTDLDQSAEFYDLPEAVDEYGYGDDPPEPKRRSPRWLSWLRRCLVVTLVPTLALFAFCGGHNVFAPDTTAFMRNNPGAIHEWVDLDHISRYPIAAVLVPEDVDMGNRVNAFDVGRFIGKAQSYLGGQSDIEGGSTIPQQLVENLYFSSDRSAWRKAGEAVVSLPFAWTVSDGRMAGCWRCT